MPRLLSPDPGEAVDRQTILSLKIHYGSAGSVAPTKNLDERVSKDEVEPGVSRAQCSRTTLSDIPPINIQPFIDENESLQRYLEENFLFKLTPAQGVEFDKLFDELGEVNHQVWKLTDQAHILKDAPDRAQEQANQRAAEVLYATIELNDKRSDIVGRINAMFGVRVREKIFA